MFRIEVYCDDKKLAYVLWALAGHVLGSPNVMPVVNAKKSGGKIKQATNGKLLDLFTDHVRKEPQGTSISARYVKDFLQGIGNSSASYGYVLKNAQAAKVIRKVGKGTHSKYAILPVK